MLKSLLAGATEMISFPSGIALPTRFGHARGLQLAGAAVRPAGHTQLRGGSRSGGRPGGVRATCSTRTASVVALAPVDLILHGHLNGPWRGT